MRQEKPVDMTTEVQCLCEAADIERLREQPQIARELLANAEELAGESAHRSDTVAGKAILALKASLES